MSKDRRYLGWGAIYEGSQALARFARKEIGEPQGIIGIARGGLVPATIMAHIFDIKPVISVSIVSYDKETKTARPVITALDKARLASVGKGKGWLIVDDICDTGETIKVMREYLPCACVVTLMLNKDCLIKPDFCYSFKEAEEWVVFPWENVGNE